MTSIPNPAALTTEQTHEAADELVTIAAEKYRAALAALVLFLRLAHSHGLDVEHLAAVAGLDRAQVAALINQGEL